MYKLLTLFCSLLLATISTPAHGISLFKSVFSMAPKTNISSQEVDSLYALAVEHFDKQDFIKARELFTQVAKADHADAQYRLALMCLQGQGGNKHRAYAIELCKKAALQGHVDAQYRLGNLHSATGEYDVAETYYLQAAAQDHTMAQYNLGALYKNRGDYVKALPLFQQAAAKKNSPALNALGQMHEKGFGTAQDYSKAKACYELADDTEGQHALGHLYLHGLGVPQNYTHAKHFFEPAAQQGNMYASFELGKMYYDGLGVQSDPEKAEQLYAQAAKKGFELAYLALISMHSRTNPTKAYRWARAAADQGSRHGLEILVYMYNDGMGVQQDSEKAGKLAFLLNALNTKQIIARPEDIRDALQIVLDSDPEEQFLGKIAQESDSNEPDELTQSRTQR